MNILDQCWRDQTNWICNHFLLNQTSESFQADFASMLGCSQQPSIKIFLWSWTHFKSALEFFTCKSLVKPNQSINISIFDELSKHQRHLAIHTHANTWRLVTERRQSKHGGPYWRICTFQDKVVKLLLWIPINEQDLGSYHFYSVHRSWLHLSTKLYHFRSKETFDSIPGATQESSW